MAQTKSLLEEKIEMQMPLIGLYDAPDPAVFEPIVEPDGPGHLCVFKYFNHWSNGETLHLTVEKHGCDGCANALFDHQVKSRNEYLDFLVDGEGLKKSKTLMNQWIDRMNNYQPEYNHIFIGPLKTIAGKFLKTVTYFITPDQLSLLVYAANYHAAPMDPAPIIAPFGAGCMQLISVFDDLSIAQAAIGATDLAMRMHVPKNILAFTTTVPMHTRINQLDEQSFLGKPFLKSLKARRNIY